MLFSIDFKKKLYIAWEIDMVQKVFLTQSGKADFFCPECQTRKQMDISKFVHIDKEIKLKITCKCSHIFSVVLERRKHVRKDVRLSGILIDGKKQYPVIIMDISRLGLKIKTKQVLDLNIDDKILVKFTLDDAKESRVSKDVIITKIDQEYISTRFLSQEHYDTFGTYLLFHFD